MAAMGRASGSINFFFEEIPKKIQWTTIFLYDQTQFFIKHGLSFRRSTRRLVKYERKLNEDYPGNFPLCVENKNSCSIEDLISAQYHFTKWEMVTNRCHV